MPTSLSLSLFLCHHHTPSLLHNPLTHYNNFPITRTGKRRPSNSNRRNPNGLPFLCSFSSFKSNDTAQPANDGRRALLASLLTTAASVCACDVAEAVSTSRRALRGAKVPESEFTTLPNGLKYYDLKVGGGAKAEKGSRVAVHYVAKWKGVTFMTSRQGLGVGGGTPYGFDVGESERGNVLRGLDLGVQGMKVGGQRLLIVPPELAYGSKGVQEIPPNATIELDVELLAIKQSPFGSPVKIVEGQVDTKITLQCANDIDPCCTFVAGGMPSAYMIRLHNLGCRTFRSIIHLDPEKPAVQWEEGLEIQWTPPPEPVCFHGGDLFFLSSSSNDCYCSKKILETLQPAGKATGVAKAREDLLTSSNGGKSSRRFQLKETKKATNNSSRKRALGSGGFGEVYKGELQDGTTVAVKSARGVASKFKRTEQVLNEVGILSQVIHKNLVNLLEWDPS
ncbi:hypothetical protein CMV_030515 [Castanea mollissima]|uniref:peptidylprolyl isomerase n=1 Tax=Castanea mollissima TaxID=60419 RepID=A0A8J4Q560_9ROSI|nr:hypothetical protein CMV_030515 [Castanea mollissima]